MANNKFSETDRIFYSDGYRLAQSAGESVTSELLFGIQSQLYQVVDGLIDSLLGQAARSSVGVDCAKGCAWCCHQPVYANSAEILYLLEYIRKNFSPEKIQEIMARAETKNRKASGLGEHRISALKHPCPLLEEESCTVYPARPMACRIYLSASVESCRHFFTYPDDKEQYPALLDFPLRAGRMLNEGVTAAFRQKGFTVGEYRIEEGLLTLYVPGISLE